MHFPTQKARIQNLEKKYPFRIWHIKINGNAYPHNYLRFNSRIVTLQKKIKFSIGISSVNADLVALRI